MQRESHVSFASTHTFNVNGSRDKIELRFDFSGVEWWLRILHFAGGALIACVLPFGMPITFFYILLSISISDVYGSFVSLCLSLFLFNTFGTIWTMQKSYEFRFSNCFICMFNNRWFTASDASVFSASHFVHFHFHLMASNWNATGEFPCQVMGFLLFKFANGTKKINKIFLAQFSELTQNSSNRINISEIETIRLIYLILLLLGYSICTLRHQIIWIFIAYPPRNEVFASLAGAVCLRIAWMNADTNWIEFWRRVRTMRKEKKTNCTTENDDNNFVLSVLFVFTRDEKILKLVCDCVLVYHRVDLMYMTTLFFRCVPYDVHSYVKETHYSNSMLIC